MWSCYIIAVQERGALSVLSGLSPTATMMFDFDRIPVDVVSCVLRTLVDAQDLYHCTLVNTTFYEATIPWLYRSLDNRALKLVGG